MQYSVSIIVPVEYLDNARSLAWALGHDSPPLSTFAAPLSTDGTEITHYAAHTYAVQSFVDTLDAAQHGTLPPVPWSDYDLTEQAVLDVVAAMTIVHAQGSVADTWPLALEQAGVQPIPEISGYA